MRRWPSHRSRPAPRPIRVKSLTRRRKTALGVGGALLLALSYLAVRGAPRTSETQTATTAALAAPHVPQPVSAAGVAPRRLRAQHSGCRSTRIRPEPRSSKATACWARRRSSSASKARAWPGRAHVLPAKGRLFAVHHRARRRQRKTLTCWPSSWPSRLIATPRPSREKAARDAKRPARKPSPAATFSCSVEQAREILTRLGQ